MKTFPTTRSSAINLPATNTTLFDFQDHSISAELATGYFRLGVWDDEPADRIQAKADQTADIVDTTAQLALGMTLGCASDVTTTKRIRSRSVIILRLPPTSTTSPATETTTRGSRLKVSVWWRMAKARNGFRPKTAMSELFERNDLVAEAQSGYARRPDAPS